MQRVIGGCTEIGLFIRVIPMSGKAKRRLIAFDLRRKYQAEGIIGIVHANRIVWPDLVCIGERAMCLVETPETRVCRGHTDVMVDSDMGGDGRIRGSELAII